ncbi:MAG TPA: Fe-S cluster assembly protein NifU [Chitinispirillaceae bacterium]|nr:Fe-S cluster assembly protein NifU [Chitinispirillaceae bacterium]
MWNYTDKVRDHYLNPRNVGEIEQPDGYGEIGNLTCGDALRLTFKLDENGKVSDIRFKTFGCGSAIASASVLTEMCKGKTLDEIKKISNKDIAEALGGLPKEKMHCSVMGQEALEAAIKFYETGGEIPVKDQAEGKIICTCFGVTDKTIEKAIRENGLRTIEEVTNFTKAGGACGGCHGGIQKILDKVNGNKSSEKVKNSPRLTTLQKIDKIREVITADINPILLQDGGSCELVDVDGNDVFIKFKGHCMGCAFSGLTLKSVVEKKLHEAVSDQLSVKLSEQE